VCIYIYAHTHTHTHTHTKLFINFKILKKNYRRENIFEERNYCFKTNFETTELEL